jgi:hypothetical protein
MTTEHDVFYMRKATEAKDGKDGFVYLHRWSTGHQELIFPTQQAAVEWVNKMNQSKED